MTDDENIEEDGYPQRIQDLMSALGQSLRAQWESEAVPQRRDTEQRWLADLMQYKARYSWEELQRMDPNQSQVYVPLTRKKVNTIHARLVDMLFPAAAQRNWALEPANEPTLDPRDEMALQQEAQQLAMQYEQAVMQAQAQGEEPPPQPEFDMDQRRTEIAEERAKAMRERMDDQLRDAKYSDIAGGDVILNGCIYGDGILKGPLVDERVQTRYQPDPETGQWANIGEVKLEPYLECVDNWDVYPDMAARDWDDVRYVYQRHVMPRHDLLDLAKREDFDAEAIFEYVQSRRTGDVTEREHDYDLRTLGERSGVSEQQGRYELLEFWGPVSVEDLLQASPETEDEVQGLEEVWVNLWLLGPLIIKVAVEPMEGQRPHPYHAFSMYKDRTSIFAEGVPAMLRHDQAMMNASTRAMLDNAAVASGPMFEANMSLMAPGEDPTKIWPRRVFLRQGTGQEAQYPAMRPLSVNSHMSEYMNLIQVSERWAHEHTVPSYMEGAPTTSGGAQGTASGLSMLMGAANIDLKKLVRNFDNGITKPFIGALYAWNMAYSDDPAIKGDYEIKARGSSSLVAKEIRAEALDRFAAQSMGTPFESWIRWEELLRRRMEVQDLDESLMLSEEEHQQAMQAQQENNPELIKQQMDQMQAQIDEAKAQADIQETQADTEKTAAETEKLRLEIEKLRQELMQAPPGAMQPIPSQGPMPTQGPMTGPGPQGMGPSMGQPMPPETAGGY
ncbi:hypothetical protein [Thioalkalivibrio sp. ALE12]|uniref:hypothetical protein n=1 Tax=Thioalkalivibrio sp. ALE12 TaxID=1158170 RepID=UPI0003716BCF|nr:hypothetical protein [Thioalkalivibrio sp. ALE12]